MKYYFPVQLFYLLAFLAIIRSQDFDEETDTDAEEYEEPSRQHVYPAGSSKTAALVGAYTSTLDLAMNRFGAQQRYGGYGSGSDTSFNSYASSPYAKSYGNNKKRTKWRKGSKKHEESKYPSRNNWKKFKGGKRSKFKG